MPAAGLSWPLSHQTRSSFLSRHSHSSGAFAALLKPWVAVSASLGCQRFIQARAHAEMHTRSSKYEVL